jgi:hypothetical protein
VHVESVSRGNPYVREISGTKAARECAGAGPCAGWYFKADFDAASLGVPAFETPSAFFDSIDILPLPFPSLGSSRVLSGGAEYDSRVPTLGAVRTTEFLVASKAPATLRFVGRVNYVGTARLVIRFD